MPGRLFTPPRVTGPSRRALDRYVATLVDLGRVDRRVDGLVLEVGRRAADQADQTRDDAEQRYHHAAALKLLLEVEARLYNRGGPTDDAFDALLAAATDPAAPGDAAG